MHFFPYSSEMSPSSWNREVSQPPSSPPTAELDVISLGRRVRHLRKQAGLTLDDLSAAVGTAPSQLSLIENGKREPKLGLLQQLAAATTTVREIMTTHVHSVPPQCKIPECIMLMHAKGIRHLPVVSRNAVIGVLSVRDLMGALIERHERLLRRFSEERLTLLYPSPSSY